MSKVFDFIEQDSATRSLIESSLYRCDKAGLPSHCSSLPEVAEEDVARSKSQVSGHIMLIRNSAPFYYKHLTSTLSANDACLCYISEGCDIFGRYGNPELKDELKSINLCLGTNLKELKAGTNAAIIASRSPGGVWVIGDDHYMDALKPYACYAFPIHGRYRRSSLIMLITRKANLTPRVCELFRFIESTENIFSAGLVTDDVLIKDTLLSNKYSEQQTDNIVIIVGSNGLVTYANEVFYDAFRTDYRATINKTLRDLIPELSFTLDCLDSGQNITMRRVFIGKLKHGDNALFADCTPISKDDRRLGMVITVYKAKKTTGSEGSCSAKYCFDDLLGVSAGFTQLKSFAERIACTHSPVLIQGDSGTGKELFAHAIHSASGRRDKPFVSLNCAAIPRDLIGSELFGYVGGAFTGANRAGAKGKFELADGGTLFLDEIGEMPTEMQSVLLRVLEDNSVTRIGGNRPVPVDVRLITATNRNLQAYIREGKFRLDLYYRLNVIILNMIPLHERRDDIPMLADSFLRQFSRANKTHINGITSDAMRALIDYDWPGNVRELRNTIERGVVTSDNGYIELRNLPNDISKLNLTSTVAKTASDVKAPASPPLRHAAETDSVDSNYLHYRSNLAKALMEEHGGNKALVARSMGISRSTLYRILNEIQD